MAHQVASAALFLPTRVVKLSCRFAGVRSSASFKRKCSGRKGAGTMSDDPSSVFVPVNELLDMLPSLTRKWLRRLLKDKVSMSALLGLVAERTS
jgi:hypothetical protein